MIAHDVGIIRSRDEGRVHIRQSVFKEVKYAACHRPEPAISDNRRHGGRAINAPYRDYASTSRLVVLIRPVPLSLEEIGSRLERLKCLPGYTGLKLVTT